MRLSSSSLRRALGYSLCASLLGCAGAPTTDAGVDALASTDSAETSAPDAIALDQSAADSAALDAPDASLFDARPESSAPDAGPEVTSRDVQPESAAEVGADALPEASAPDSSGDGPACLRFLEGCSSDTACCSGTCAAGQCRCLPTFAPCSRDEACCSGACAGGQCACATLRLPCVDDSDCCGRLVCTVGFCMP